MLDAYVRHAKDNLLSPLLSPLPPALHPNHLTLLGFTVGLLTPLCSYADRPRWAIAAWLGNRLLDGLDGAVARARGKASAWGGFLDILCDFTIYSLLPMGIAFSPSHRSIPTLIALSALLASFHINNVILFYLSAALPTPPTPPPPRPSTHGNRSFTEKRTFTSLRMMPTLTEGTESLILFSLMLLLPSRFVLIAGSMTGLVVINVVQRTVVAWGLFREEDERVKGI